MRAWSRTRTVRCQGRKDILRVQAPEAPRFFRNLSIMPGSIQRREAGFVTNAVWTLVLWSTGRELNPRILVLQTSALATSPPVLIFKAKRRPLGETALSDCLLRLDGEVLLC